MALKDDITRQVTEALKAKDSLRVATLRFFLASIQSKEKELKRDLEDVEIEKIAKTQAKQRNDSIEQFEKGGRADLADKERAELEILKDFMPEELSPDDIRAAVKEVIAETGAAGMGDMGKVMKGAMAKLGGSADGKAVNAIVKEELS